jgi:hypothetical protein
MVLRFYIKGDFFYPATRASVIKSAMIEVYL